MFFFYYNCFVCIVGYRAALANANVTNSVCVCKVMHIANERVSQD